MEENNQTKADKVKYYVKEIIFYVILFLVCFFVIPKYVIERTEVEGSSMESNYYNLDQVLTEKVSKRFDKLERFDVIILTPEFLDENMDDDPTNDKDYIKRIIGLPGEEVWIVGSDIYINGEKLVEDYGKEPIKYSGRAILPIKLADDEYFVLGDNRNASTDSRSDVVGNVKKSRIVGKVIFRIYPFSRFGKVR